MFDNEIVVCIKCIFVTHVIWLERFSFFQIKLDNLLYLEFALWNCNDTENVFQNTAFSIIHDE